jgi:hypothetical protein
LVLNSAALEYYFKKIGEKVDFDLIAVMPMNARKEGDTGPGNVLTIARVSLHNTIPNLAARLRAIAADTARIKAQHRSKAGGAAVNGRALMELFSPLVIDSLCFAVAGLDLTSRMMLGNVAITNVPGSPVPLYLAGAPVVSGVPMAPVLGSVTGLTITVSSTDQYLLFGYHADGSAVKEKDHFVKGAMQAFAKLKSAAARAGTAASRPKQRRRVPRKHPRAGRQTSKNRAATSVS